MKKHPKKTKDNKRRSCIEEKEQMKEKEKNKRRRKCSRRRLILHYMHGYHSCSVISNMLCFLSFSHSYHVSTQSFLYFFFPLFSFLFFINFFSPFVYTTTPPRGLGGVVVIDAAIGAHSRGSRPALYFTVAATLDKSLTSHCL